MKEIKNLYLKVDQVEPIYKCGGFYSENAWLMDGIRVWIGNEGHKFECDQFTVCDPDAVREDAYRQMLALMREIYDMTGTERREAFGKTLFGVVINGATYDDLAKKLDTWKKEKETIQVRDEVENKNNGMRMIVTYPPYQASNSIYYFSGIRKDGKVYRDEMVNAYKKTGVHIDNIDAYLEV